MMAQYCRVDPPSSLPTMLPKTLALIDDDVEYTEFLSQYLRERA